MNLLAARRLGHMNTQFLKWIPAFTGMTISTMSTLRKQRSRMKVERNISISSKIMHLTQPPSYEASKRNPELEKPKVSQTLPHKETSKQRSEEFTPLNCQSTVRGICEITLNKWREETFTDWLWPAYHAHAGPIFCFHCYRSSSEQVP